jgi:hypothetical protein
LKKKDGTVQRLYDYWVLGKNAGKNNLDGQSFAMCWVG